MLERLDQAALRRFTFKIQFKPLGRIQREQAFVKLARQGDASALTASLQARLAGVEQSEVEHRIKPEVREAGNMGFLV